MARGNQNYTTDLKRSTLESVMGGVVDQTFRQFPLTELIMKRGNVTPMSGTKITLATMSGQNPNFQWIPLSGPVTLDQPTVLDRPEWEFRRCSIGLTLQKFELMQNSGKEQVADIVKTALDQMELTYKQSFEDSMLSAGGTTGIYAASQLDGLQMAVRTGLSSWNTYGNIDRTDAANASWRNKYLAAAAPGAQLDDTGALVQWSNFFIQCSDDNNSDPVDLILISDLAWGYLADSKLFEKYQITKADGNTGPSSTGFGMGNLFYRGAQIRYISNSNFIGSSAQGATSASGIQNVYFLNTKYWHIVPLAGFKNGLLIEKFDEVPGSFLKVAQGFWSGNVVCKFPGRQGLLTYTSIS